MFIIIVLLLLLLWKTKISHYRREAVLQRGGSREGEDAELKVAKKKTKELEAKVESLVAEKGERELKLFEAIKNEESASAAAMALNDQVSNYLFFIHQENLGVHIPYIAIGCKVGC